VLVERPDRLRGLLREAELACDVGATLAARLEEVELRALLEAEQDECCGTTERRALGRDVPDGPDEVLSGRLVHSTVFTPRLSRRSSPRKSEQILAAFDEQPASLSRRA